MEEEVIEVYQKQTGSFGGLDIFLSFILFPFNPFLLLKILLSSCGVQHGTEDWHLTSLKLPVI